MQERKKTSLTGCVLAALMLWSAGCGGVESVREAFESATPHERYARSLQEAGVAETALGRAWLAASRRALDEALVVETPFREVGYLDPAQPTAVGYRIAARRGQELRIRVMAPPGDSARLFVDLFRTAEDTANAPEHVASADTTGRLTAEATANTDYLLRLQPELLSGGRYTLTIRAGASLAVFPVEGSDSRAIRSFFGDARDGGARRHHGVDIFAPRGTPVVAVTDGYVTRRTGGLGGKTVWLRDLSRGRSFYYAHLDSQLVRSRTRVRAGDTLGLVGNTGNARTTPPHLHFGLYQRGPADPYPFVHEPRIQAATVTADTSRIGGWSRTTAARTNLRAGPTTASTIRRALPRHTMLRLGGSSGAWHRVRLPDGTAGFIAASLLRPASDPLRTARLGSGALLHRPASDAPAVDSLEGSARASVFGQFGDFLYVRSPRGRTGWIRENGAR